MLVAGDLYDSAAPSAAAQQLVVRTLIGARARTGARGRRDRRQPRPRRHARCLPAVRRAAGITMVGRSRTAEQGGVVEFTARSGERATVAVLPFLSQRYAVRAAELVATHARGEHRRVRPAGPRHRRRR